MSGNIVHERTITTVLEGANCPQRDGKVALNKGTSSQPLRIRRTDVIVSSLTTFFRGIEPVIAIVRYPSLIEYEKRRRL